MKNEFFLKQLARHTSAEPTDILIDFDSDISKDREAKEEAKKKWASNSEIRNQYGNNFREYFVKQFPDNDVLSYGVKNRLLIEDEMNARRNEYSPHLPMLIDIIDSENTLLDIIESNENIDHIKEVYKKIKLKSNTTDKGGLNSAEANNIKYCLRQGRELYLSGKNSGTLVKPLVYFYSITAFAYAVILLNSPFRYKLEDIRNSHGIEHKLDNSCISFGGAIKSGTFSELFYSLCSTPIMFNDGYGQASSFYIDRTESLRNFQNGKFDLSLLSIFSMMPEMASVLNLPTKSVFDTNISMEISKKEIMYKISIGNGNDTIQDTSLDTAFGSHERKISEGRYVVFIPQGNIHSVKASFYTDVYGKTWFIDSPVPVIQLPEICLHFMAMFTLSNIMRYQPQLWGAILANEHDTRISTLVRYYLTLFERKLPFIVLRNTSELFPMISV